MTSLLLWRHAAAHRQTDRWTESSEGIISVVHLAEITRSTQTAQTSTCNLPSADPLLPTVTINTESRTSLLPWRTRSGLVFFELSESLSSNNCISSAPSVHSANRAIIRLFVLFVYYFIYTTATITNLHLPIRSRDVVRLCRLIEFMCCIKCYLAIKSANEPF